MAYHSLTKESGGNEYDRRLEASRILDILTAESVMERDDLTQDHREFLRKMFADRKQTITTKQLFWLRDIKDKYLD